ncbi:MAG: hypothetical protein WAV25_00095 [Minisyncoccia bacterium]
MKQKSKTILVVGAMLSVLPFMAMAETTDTVQPVSPTTKVEVRDARVKLEQEVKQKREEVKNEIKDLKDSKTKEIKDLKDEGKKEIQGMRNDIRGIELTNRVNNTVRMLTATANRLDMIISRIDSRLAKVKLAKADTTAVEAELATAKTDMASVRIHIGIISAIDLSGASTTVKANFEQVKTESKLTKDLFDKVRKNLEKINNDLRNLGKEKKVKDEAPKTEDTSSTTPIKTDN